MKRPGQMIAASKESEVVDEVSSLTSRDKVLKILVDKGPLSMMKISVATSVNPRTLRTILAEFMGMNVVVKAECTQCGSHMTYKIA